MSDPYYFSKTSCFRFSPIPLTIDNQLWRSAYKMLWFSIPSRFSPCFSIKVNKHCLACWDYLNDTYGGGGNMCPTLQKNNQNKTQKLPRFQNPLIPVHIIRKKNRPLSPPPKKPNQPTTNKREALRSWRTKDTSDPVASVHFYNKCPDNLACRHQIKYI